MRRPLPESPFPRCPLFSACYRESRAYSGSAPDLFATATRCVRELSGLTIGHAAEIHRRPSGLSLRATFQVYFFTDTLDLVAAPHDGGAVLHVRSRSRVGGVDLGVNRRRVRALLDSLEAACAVDDEPAGEPVAYR